MQIKLILIERENNSMKYIVYCTTNFVNNKIYIGVHKTEDPNIFDGYIGNGVKIGLPGTYMKPKTAFQAAVKKYGVDKFSRKILYIYDTAQEAYLKEKELVDEDFLKLDTNYNMILGGGEERPTEPINQFSESGEFIKKWQTLEDACSFFNCSMSAFRTAMHFKEKLLGYFWSRESTIDVTTYSKGDNKKPVYKYSKTGKLLANYPSLLQASKDENTTPSTLITAIQGASLVNKEFYYSFDLYDVFIPKAKQSLRGKKFYIYTLEGSFIKEIKDSKELLDFMGVKSFSSIWDAIQRRNGLYKTFQIKTEFTETVPPLSNKSLAKKVDVYDKEGNLIKTCDSVQKAAQEFNAKVSSINRVLRGLACTTAGYVFKFHKN